MYRVGAWQVAASVVPPEDAFLVWWAFFVLFLWVDLANT